VKCVSGLNRNPHADLWVRKDAGLSLLSCIRDRTRVHMADWGSLAATARRNEEVVASHLDVTEEGSILPPLPRDEGRSAHVQGWRLALWWPWRERRMKPSKPQLIRLLRGSLPTSVATYNANGYWSKVVEIGELLDEEYLAVLVETHYSTR
jgi:hypothetical protein